MTAASPPRAFRSSAALRAWLQKHHAARAELMLLCHKTHAATRGVTHRQALDEALCFGWIDGVRRGIDADTFVVRFSPRKARSYWSAVNLRRFAELKAQGLVRPPGLAAFEARTAAKGKYSFESRPKALDPAAMKKLRANRAALAFFQAQAPWYRRTCAFWVMSAKRDETRARRLGILIEHCAEGRRIPPLAGPVGRGD
jgi:uncharacterized protein YdeI (YjbR/CyaY-like superfamily)